MYEFRVKRKTAESLAGVEAGRTVSHEQVRVPGRT